MARKPKAADAAQTEIQYAYGIRTWGKDGSSYGGFKWDLAVGARTTAPDFNDNKVCGYGLHANKDGWGDWSLLGLDASGADKVIGIVRWDAAQEVDLVGKVKAPWMEVVMTSQTASLATIYGFISDKWRERAAIEKCEASATGNYGHASATGDRGHASATGYRGHASATGNYGHASATGENAIAASLGGGKAKASKSGAIMLSAYGSWDGKGYPLMAVFAGMVGQTFGEITIKSDTFYSLTVDGVLVEEA